VGSAAAGWREHPLSLSGRSSRVPVVGQVEIRQWVSLDTPFVSDGGLKFSSAATVRLLQKYHKLISSYLTTNEKPSYHR